MTNEEKEQNLDFIKKLKNFDKLTDKVWNDIGELAILVECTTLSEANKNILNNGFHKISNAISWFHWEPIVEELENKYKINEVPNHWMAE